MIIFRKELVYQASIQISAKFSNLYNLRETIRIPLGIQVCRNPNTSQTMKVLEIEERIVRFHCGLNLGTDSFESNIQLLENKQKKCALNYVDREKNYSELITAYKQIEKIVTIEVNFFSKIMSCAENPITIIFNTRIDSFNCEACEL